MKKLLRAFITDPLFTRIDQRLVRPAREDADRRIAEVAAEVEGLGQHFPFLVSRLSEVNALSRETQRRLSAAESGIETAGHEREAMAARIAQLEAELGDLRGEIRSIGSGSAKRPSDGVLK